MFTLNANVIAAMAKEERSYTTNGAYTTNSGQWILKNRLHEKRAKFKGYFKNLACE
jgi:hypothetical protein